MHVSFGALDVVVQVVPEHEELVYGSVPARTGDYVLPFYRKLEEVDVASLGGWHKQTRGQLGGVL